MLHHHTGNGGGGGSWSEPGGADWPYASSGAQHRQRSQENASGWQLVRAKSAKRSLGGGWAGAAWAKSAEHSQGGGKAGAGDAARGAARGAAGGACCRAAGLRAARGATFDSNTKSSSNVSMLLLPSDPLAARAHCK